MSLETRIPDLNQINLDHFYILTNKNVGDFTKDRQQHLTEVAVEATKESVAYNNIENWKGRTLNLYG